MPPTDPVTKSKLGEQLHEWLRQGHAMNLFSAVQEAQGGGAPLMRPLPVTDRAVAAFAPLNNRVMAEVLGVSSMSKVRDDSSPRRGLTIHHFEHNGILSGPWAATPAHRRISKELGV